MLREAGTLHRLEHQLEVPALWSIQRGADGSFRIFYETAQQQPTLFLTQQCGTCPSLIHDWIMRQALPSDLIWHRELDLTFVVMRQALG